MRADLPVVDPDTAPFWAAAREGRLLIRRCGLCGRAHFYPRPFCPHCWADEVAWEEASGDATLYTWSVVRRNDLSPFADRVPYVAAVVTLAEGPRMLTNLVAVDPDALAIDQKLRVTFEDRGDDLVVPVFVPA